MKKKKLLDKEENLARWIKFLLTPNEMEETDMKKDEALQKAKKEFDAIQQDEHERYLAELRMKHIMDSKAIQDYGYKTGKEEGIKQKAIEIAKNLLEKNISIEIIVETTGLTQEEVEKIKNA